MGIFIVPVFENRQKVLYHPPYIIRTVQCTVHTYSTRQEYSSRTMYIIYYTVNTVNQYQTFTDFLKILCHEILRTLLFAELPNLGL